MLCGATCFSRVVVSFCVKFLAVLVVAQLTVSAASLDDRFTPCAPANKFIEIKVTAKTVPASDSAPVHRVWVLTEIPTAEQIVVAQGDTILKPRILEIMQTIRDSGVAVGVGKAGDRQPGDPFPLELQLADLDSVRPGFQLILPAGLTNAPEVADLTQVHTVRLCLDYTMPRPPSGVEFVIKTARGETTPLPRIAGFTLADAGERFRTSVAGSIPVKLSYAQQDLDDARKDASITDDAAAIKRVKEALLSVAADSFDQGVAQGLLSAEGKPLVDRNSGGEVAANVEGEIAKRYNLNGFDPKIRWAFVKVRANVRDNTQESPWIVSVTGLEFVQQIDIEVIKSTVEMEFDDTSNEKQFDARRQQVRAKLLTAHLQSFSARPGEIVTTDDLANDQARLREDKAVKTVEEISSGANDAAPPTRNLIYFVSRRLMAEKIMSLKIGGSYSPEEHVTGNIALDETNILGIAEVSKLSYSGGPQTQRIRFTFDRPFESVDTAGWQIKSAGVNVQYFTDKDMRFSNLTPDEIAARETGSTAQISFAYDSFSLLDSSTADCLENKDRKRTRFNLKASPVLAYRDVNIKEDNLLLTVTKIDRSLLPRARTQTTTLSLDTNLGFSHDFRQPNKAGAGVLNLGLQGRLQRGFRLFGADYNYNKISATISGEFLFGVISARDVLLRYNRVMSTATHGTPIFELNRLGGPQTVRGLEEGEFIGRRLSADQVEVGVNALILWNLIGRKPIAETLLRTSCSEQDEGQPALPFDIRNAFLKVFYDRGRINDRDSFLIPGKQTRVAQGYGVAIEIRSLGGKNINLSIGYAYSPESTLHRSGTIYTGVTYAF